MPASGSKWSKVEMPGATVALASVALAERGSLQNAAYENAANKFEKFHGGVVTDAKKSAGTTAKLTDTQIRVPEGSTKTPQPFQPEMEYTTKLAAEFKMPSEHFVEVQGLGAQTLEPADVKKKGWDEVDQEVARPADGTRMRVRAAPGAFESKFLKVKPRPAAAPPMPTNSKLSDGMVVTLEDSDREHHPGSADLVVARFPEPKKNKDGVYEPAKWRMELKCEAWSRALGVLAETPTASFKIANAASKKLQVRGATVAMDGKSSLWTEWREVPPPNTGDTRLAAKQAGEAERAKLDARPQAKEETAAAPASSASVTAGGSGSGGSSSEGSGSGGGGGGSGSSSGGGGVDWDSRFRAMEAALVEAQRVARAAEGRVGELSGHVGELTDRLAEAERRAEAAEAELRAAKAAGESS